MRVWVCVAGVVVVSMEGHGISESLGLSEPLGHLESWDILSPMRHSLSARRHSRIAVEKGALHMFAMPNERGVSKCDQDNS